MPTYDLLCEDCGERFEVFLTRILRDGDKLCPSCGSTQVRTGVGGGFLGVAGPVSDSGCAPRGGFS